LICRLHLIIHAQRPSPDHLYPALEQELQISFDGLEYHSALGARGPTRPPQRREGFGENWASLDGLSIYLTCRGCAVLQQSYACMQ